MCLQGLRDMGYRLSDDELQRLMNAIGGNHDSVSRSTIMASQIDWRHLQVCVALHLNNFALKETRIFLYALPIERI